MPVEAETRELLVPSAPDVRPDNKRLIRLEVTQVRPYDRNPRRCPNSEYGRIKASIRAEGLDQPLVVTRRSGETDYMLFAGGNTRLLAMLSLYEETGDDAFRYVDCVFKPWVAESDVLLSHLRENELRDNLNFIDKALAVLEAKALLEREAPGQALSQRKLSKVITARGLSFSQALISRMAYAVQTLWPLIPQALSAGMGSPQVVRIQALDRATRAIWSNRSLGTELEFDDTFATLCRRYDSPDWSTEVLRGALETEIAEAADADLALVRLELDAQLARRPLPVIALDALEGRSTEALGRTAAQSKRVFVESANDATAGLERVPQPEATIIKGRADLERVTGEEQHTLGHLRQRACQLATQLAQAHGLGQVITPLCEQGVGFLVQDVPDAALIDVLDEDLAQLVLAVWWQLVACAEVMAAPATQLMTQLKAGSPLQAAVANSDPSMLFSAIPPAEPGRVGTQLWRWLNDEDLQTLVALMETYRALHRVSRESGQPLWGG